MTPPPRRREEEPGLAGPGMLALGLALVLIPLVAAFLVVTVPAGSPSPGTAARSPSPSTRPSPTLAGPTASPTPSLPPATAPPTPSLPPATVRPTPTPTPRPTIVAAGAFVPIEQDGEVVGQAAVAEYQLYDLHNGQPAPAGRRWMAVRVTLQASQDGTLEYEPTDWVVRDGKGREFEYVGRDLEPALGEGRVRPGASRTGYISFQVRRASRRLFIEYRGPDGLPVFAVRVQT